VTESRTRATEIVRRQFLDAGVGRGAPDDVPEHLRRLAIAPDSPRLVDRAKDAPVRQTRRLRPGVYGGLHPRRHRDRSDVSALADEIGDDPVLLPLLDGFQGEPQRLAPSLAKADAQSPSPSPIASAAVQPSGVRGEWTSPAPHSRAYTDVDVAVIPGTRLGAYDITPKMGEGGMGAGLSRHRTTHR
jgi:hypothetical protein